MLQSACPLPSTSCLSPETPSKSALGPITRKQQKKISFTRKKNFQLFVGQIIPDRISTRLSRDKIKSTTCILQQQRSLEFVKVNLQDEIKFMSPKNYRSSKIITQLLPQQAQKSPKFARKRQNKLEDQSPLSTLNQGQTSNYNDQFAPIISRISLQSVINKEEQLDTRTNTHQDDRLQFENRRLRRQNLKLTQELDKIKDELNLVSEQLNKINQNVGSSFFSLKCKKEESGDRKNRKQINFLQGRLAQKDKQIDCYRARLFDTEVQLDRQRQRVTDLEEQVQTLHERLEQSNNLQLQLTNIITILKQKIGSDAQEMRSLEIQQCILLRKKHEGELSKSQTAKLKLQRQSLRKMISEYKQKIESLGRAFSHSRQCKKEKEILGDDLFELSSEMSTDAL